MEGVQEETLEQKIERLEAENAELRERNGILEEAHTELINQNEELSHGAFYDALTGLKNRRFFDEEMRYHFVRAFDSRPESGERRESGASSPGQFAMAIFDIDKFKNVNDGLGHQMGDEVLKAVAQTIQSYTRKSDLVSRWGGEEIAVIFAGATKEGAALKADFIRRKIEEITFAELPGFKITASAGLAHSSDFRDSESLFRSADKALYKSKQNGRNQVTVSDGD